MEQIKGKLAIGELHIVDNTSSKVKSDIWQTFGIIKDNDGNTVSGFAACKKCKKVLAYNSRKLGTSSLKKHTTDTCRDTGVAAIDTYFLRNAAALKPPKQEDKEAITQLAVKFGLIDIGARVGSVDAQQLLPDPTTVSRRLTNQVDDTRQKIIPELWMQLTDCSGAVTVDMWTDDYRKIGYLCVTLHYINNRWELTERVLCTSEWDSELRKTAENIRPAIIQALRKYSLDEFFSKLVYVTDRGANIVTALRSVTRLSCAPHILNTVLHTAIGKPSEEDVFSEEVSAVIDSSKSLVTYFKQTNLQTRLKKTLKASVKMRWNSLHTMLERGEHTHLANINKKTLSDIVAFLARFKEAIKALEASKTLTIHLTVVWLEHLKRHLQPSSTDSLMLTSLKEKCLKILSDKFHLHLLHKLAMFLHPKLKSMKLLSNQAEVNTVHSEARRLVQGKIKLRDSTASPHVHHQRRGQKRIADVDDSSDEGLQPEDEVAAYINYKTPKEDPFDLLCWWREHATVFPNLALIARSVLAIPASSAASERDFSAAGFVIQERRTQLKPGTVDDMLFMHIILTGSGGCGLVKLDPCRTLVYLSFFK
uniref:BED-type domain-containing protein n=1 Tax=Cyprinodon variegatus TaxID=28743 RepID=A0A3Q2CJ70_CYPVA